MAFGPESTNPREMRSYAHTMIAHLAEGEVNFGEAMDAAYRASLTVKGAASGFEGALENAATGVQVKERGTSGHRTIRRVPLDWQHPIDENGSCIPLFDTREGGGRYTLSEMTELAKYGSDFATGNMHAAFMPTFRDVPDSKMGVSLYETTTEGTPLTPIFPDTIEGHKAFAEYAAEHATIFGSEKASAEYWQAIFFGAEEVIRPYESEAWDMAYDEKYRREGKTAFLRDPVEIELLVGTLKTDAIDDFHRAYLLGAHVTAAFNDDTMSSREIGELGIDGAYTKYFGTDKAGYEERERLWSVEYRQRQIDETNRALAEVPELVEQTTDIIKPDIANEWRRCLEIRAEDLYHGSESKSAISLMRAHSEGAGQADLRQMMDEHGHSGASAAVTLAIIRDFYIAGDSLVKILR